ncbi:hypothetical protein D7231_35145 [Streptomyces klenkii]|uniref:Uncharacterized protein n=1 Tax=Streptomyces klenkii TaxID=1420899 RepID=A0A3B0A161_9ACTN|nr:hypothetical protein [Streptomyces klenkii]RKN53336.1 hypothetical protein D7231_35145 [Streptomyces klenkii]
MTGLPPEVAHLIDRAEAHVLLPAEARQLRVAVAALAERPPRPAAFRPALAADRVRLRVAEHRLRAMATAWRHTPATITTANAASAILAALDNRMPTKETR